MKKFKILSLVAVVAVLAGFTACDKENAIKEGTPNTYTLGAVTQHINYAGYNIEGTSYFFGLCPTEIGRKGMKEEGEWIAMWFYNTTALDQEIELVDYYQFRSLGQHCVIVVQSGLGRSYYIGKPDSYTGDVLGTIEVIPERKSDEFTINLKMGEGSNQRFLLNYSGEFEYEDDYSIIWPYS